MNIQTRNPWSAGLETDLIRRGRPFVKMHGLRNDFVIVDGRERPYRPGEEEIRSICDRRVGIGADELLIIESPEPEEAGVYAAVRIINPDGREAEACGNATRCVAWLLMREAGRESLTLRTLGGRLNCTMAGEGMVTVEMGRLRTGWREIPVAEEMDTLHLGIGAGPLADPVGMNIGNPHAVFFVEDLSKVDLPRYGHELQTHPLFPEEANIGVAQMVDQENMLLSVWERPGALTTACGSGACAAVGAARRRGLTDRNRVNVAMPAGSVTIELLDGNLVAMTGPVEQCYAGYLPATQ